MPLDDTRYLKGAPVAARIIAQVRAAADKAVEEGFPPRLVSITVGDVAAVDVYVRNQRAKAELGGIDFEERRFPQETTAAELEAAIHGMNADPRVTGIIIQRPVPAHIPIKAIQAAVHPLKDVEGMHPASIGNIVYNEIELAPCTAAASVEMLKATGLDLKGLEVVVVGHSEIVGKPIAFLLMSEGATVTVCHHMTRSVAAHTRRADALFVAVGKPRLIKGDMVKPGAAVIDIGINAETAPDGSTRIVGDVDTDSVKDVASWITPVPGGVGPVTVAILLRNTMVALNRQRALYQSTYATEGKIAAE
ncbi:MULTISPECIES: bifunctional 5,10-methylenetetrahydrofolate dehydrogenase/5,10-methenyltetrahydrofolate cyclohydrolase [unclassified Mesorhizobium]|jgi:methylenetetrahydrofolate dehydrogenase (NADP+)/methenyltetrahydrofolate cyclohydrolase|uniref:bifunctional 5,10-methylenetetrahydrofolate dehydrogenase/5,10-methenyltetrahydrofolate cyclohydrolase n=1 Tax=unclassified Mesorhizobium TaxID=325217 RepID=UPI0008E7DCE0|nr:MULTISPECIES: bifunctional 5,10-methylenetetrahydrofolate dehydrogenase/5,10-methenyltetrahydrofolate cyclohydrolase [unclassified Mesorhizobium]RJG46323.1 bifunctional 5,10-methylenetetrahydrofolate dehydrogenase/5,10-methenyltetrahydrofolate cyclohydrolase [Mesorhizobium sp. DCY119]SFU00400.1 methylenetetrahydrofolate dehydrogenase (NADP+) / methenyltetrahydrofolate cyclohydrolase [Mesorhizobium sp. YR577]